jgi:hypothetical protein
MPFPARHSHGWPIENPMNLSSWNRLSTDTRAFACSVVAFIVLTGCGSQTPLDSGADVVESRDGTCPSPQVIETVEIPLFIRSQVFTPYYTARDDQGGSRKSPAFPFRKVEFSTRIDIDPIREDCGNVRSVPR